MEVFCSDCPRHCHARRTDFSPGGVCCSPYLPRVARAAPHFGEEPCISGTRGSGTVFFTGCNLRCVFCQNRAVSRGNVGEILSVAQLRDCFWRLRDQGVHNINLVTASHFVRPVAEALALAKLEIPVVWNSSGYESVESLRLLEGLVQIYLPDLKYLRGDLAQRYSGASDYPKIAAAAICEMFRQTGPYQLDADGMLRRGLLIRHLILPEEDLNSMDVIDFVAEEFPRGSVLFSLMCQYTPMPGLEAFPALQKTVDAELNERLCHYMRRRGIEDGFWQEPSAATADMIPAFDGTGLSLEQKTTKE
ncbi:MAG: radical SAM protein [Oscillospiraceae bacterium]|nr:radical SAM protein [Oscillospiraceae bacterium]